jgi:hypothetical protein
MDFHHSSPLAAAEKSDNLPPFSFSQFYQTKNFAIDAGKV